MPDETTCLCRYTGKYMDSDFQIGDSVIEAITRFDYDRRLVYGSVLSKW